MEGQGKDAHIPAKFMAGRGRALRELASRPLKAEEVEKRRRLQELILRGSVPLDKTGTVPGGLSEGKLQKLPSQASKHQNRRPDPMWTSYRSNESGIISSGSEESVGKCIPPSSLPQSEKTAQRGVHGTHDEWQSNAPSQWTESQNELSSDRLNASQYVAHGTQNKSQDNGHGSWNVTQSVAHSMRGKPQSNNPSARDATKVDANAVWNKPLGKSPGEASTPRNAHSTWGKPGRNGSNLWDVPQNGGPENWGEQGSDGPGAWDTSQTDTPSAWRKPQSVNAHVQRGKTPHNGFNQSNRSFRKAVPPRFRKKSLQQENPKGARGKPTILNHENTMAKTGESSWASASTKIENDSQQSTGKDRKAGQCATDSNPWVDWENNVVIQGSLSEEDMLEIGVIEDNDDINDVFVNQYVSAMQEEENNEKPQEEIRLTPSKIQQLSKLKSTAQADAEKLPPGTLPCPPKKLDRWGGVELQNGNGPLGWGDVGDDEGNWYEDGVSAWGKAENTPGWS